MTGTLPTFVIIGAQRSGTTSIARALEAHPEAFMVRQKEVHFFDRHFDRGLDWYRARFSGVRDEPAVGEATPAYMYADGAMARMAEVLPHAKLVTVLRNPVDRAYSHYWHERGLAREDRPFSEAIAADRAGEGGKGYLDRGKYLPQLERVVGHYPREALHVMLFEDFRDDPRAAFASLCRFLDIDDAFAPEHLGDPVNPFRMYRSLRMRLYTRQRPRTRFKRILARLNARRPRPYPPMDPAAREELVRLFREPNAALGAWLGRDLSMWDA